MVENGTPQRTINEFDDNTQGGRRNIQIAIFVKDVMTVFEWADFTDEGWDFLMSMDRDVANTAANDWVVELAGVLREGVDPFAT